MHNALYKFFLALLYVSEFYLFLAWAQNYFISSLRLIQNSCYSVYRFSFGCYIFQRNLFRLHNDYTSTSQKYEYGILKLQDEKISLSFIKKMSPTDSRTFN